MGMKIIMSWGLKGFQKNKKWKVFIILDALALFVHKMAKHTLEILQHLMM